MSEATLFWLTILAAIILATALLTYVVFIRAKLVPNNFTKVMVGSAGAILPAIWAASSGEAAGASLWDRAFVALVIMLFWGSLFGALIAEGFLWVMQRLHKSDVDAQQ